MRTMKLVAAVLALVFVAAAFAGCGAEKVSKNVTVKVVAGDDTVLNNVSITVEGTTENPPTVLQAVREALQMYEIDYTLDESEKSIKNISAYADTTDEEGNIYYWEYSVNGVVPKAGSGKAADNVVNEGDVIQYTYMVMKMVGDNAVATPYTTPAEEETEAEG